MNSFKLRHKTTVFVIVFKWLSIGKTFLLFLPTFLRLQRFIFYGNSEGFLTQLWCLVFWCVTQRHRAIEVEGVVALCRKVGTGHRMTWHFMPKEWRPTTTTTTLLLLVVLVVVLVVKIKQALRVPGGLAPGFLDSRHMEVAWLSAVRTGHLYPLGNIPGTHFC